jgi:hypothetical protein
VCTTPDSLSEVIQTTSPPPVQAETLPPLEAFGNAGPYDKAALARLYGALRPTVARTSMRVGGDTIALTFISPYPDASLTRLNGGTLIIRFIICCT